MSNDDTDWFRGQSRDQLQQFSLSFAAGVRRDNRDRPPVAVELDMVIANEEPRMPGELRGEKCPTLTLPSHRRKI